MLHNGSVSGASSQEGMLFYVFIHFFDIHYCFSSRNLCFQHFPFFLWWSIKFSQQNINQSALRIGEKRLWNVITYTFLDRWFRNNLRTMLNPTNGEAPLFISWFRHSWGYHFSRGFYGYKRSCSQNFLRVCLQKCALDCTWSSTGQKSK